MESAATLKVPQNIEMIPGNRHVPFGQGEGGGKNRAVFRNRSRCGDGQAQQPEGATQVLTSVKNVSFQYLGVSF